ncbi:MAG: transcriptional regulator [Sphingomonas bacterium]|nr:transcriptional regulator [Sphingomonas bacterium]
MHEQLDHLCDIALRHHDDGRRGGVIPRLAMHVSGAPTGAMPGMYEPMICIVLQGAKQVMIGDQALRYGAADQLIASIDLPVSGCVVEASADKPYIIVSMALNQDAVTSLLTELPPGAEEQTAGFAVGRVTPQLLDSWARLLALFDAPEDVPVLAPMLEREILYRILQGPQGGLLRQAAIADSRLSQVRTAIGWIRTHFDKPLRVEALAGLAGMSPASFHRHFKAATAMSPLQYQKSLRLQQARRLLVASADASRAAYSVGYESASQFSREYARMFGTPPARDAERLRGQGGVEVANAA